MRFRHWLARLLVSLSLVLITQAKMKEFLMTIFESLADLNTRLAVLEAAGSVDTSNFATADALAAVASDVATLKAEIGTPPDAPTS